MTNALVNAASGLYKQQRRMDTIANNIANSNTVGFKSSRVDFQTSLYRAGIVPGPPRTATEVGGNQQRGHGVRVAAIARDFNQGASISTGRPLDMAIMGEGFFSVESPAGATLYTRNGNFYLDNERFLVTGSGYFVLNDAGARIQLPLGVTSERIGVDANGVINIDMDGTVSRFPLGIFTFRNIAGLEAVGGSLYAETVASGDRLPAESAHVQQSVLESSNVNLAVEMTRLIRTQRAFQLASRAVSVADDMEGIANNIRR